MADETASAPVPELPAAFTMADFSRMLAEGITAGIAKTQRNKVPFGAYDPKTAFHPVKATAPKLVRKCFQNGVEMSWDTLHDREVELLNRITHGGRYIDRTVEVVILEDGTDSMVDIRYHNKTPDHRFANASKWRDLTDMLKQIVKAQEAEDREDEEQRQVKAAAKSRPFGNSRATQEAFARAAEKA